MTQLIGALLLMLGVTGEATPLDKALEAAKADEARRADFYDVFLATAVYVPLDPRAHPASAGEGYTTLRAGEEFTPLRFKKDGVTVLYVFDTLERLQRHGPPQSVRYFQMPAHSLVHANPPDVQLILNAGTPYSKTFSTEEVRRMREILAGRAPESVKVEEPTRLLFKAPEKVSARLVETLQAVLRRNPDVLEAFLVAASPAEGRSDSYLLLALRLNREDRLDSVANDIIASTMGSLGDYSRIDVLADDRATAEIAKSTSVFYRK